MSKDKKKYIYDITPENILLDDEIILDDVQTAACLVAKRRERFVEGYDVKKEIIRFYNKFFDSAPHLEEKGLIYFYRKAKDEIIKNPYYISLILCGLNMNDILINNYTTIDRKRIQLTVQSLSRHLIRMHFTKDELNEICMKCPNFEIYYKN